MSKVTNFYEHIPKSYLNDKFNNPNASRGVPLHCFRMVICGAAGAGKTNCIINLINDCNCFERIYIYAKSLDQPLYKFLIDRFEKIGAKVGQKLITYSDDLKDIPKTTDFDKSVQNLVIIDDMIMEKKLKAVEELYVRGRHNSISVAFLSQSFHVIPKIIRLNCNYLILRGIESIKEFKLITSNYALNETGQQLYELYKKATEDKFSWFMIDLVSTHPNMKYRKNYEPICVTQTSVSKPKKGIKLV